MKREVTYTDVEQTCSHILSPKRRKLLNSSDHCCRSTIEPQSSRTLHLTPETLGELSSQSPAPTNSIESIEQWASNCDSCSQSEMATSITSNDSSQRRVSKLNYRRQRSQSPTKKTSTQYRSRNMADASIFVDHFPEPPSDVENQIKNIFGVSALENIGQAPSDHSQVSASAIKNDIDEFAKKYCHRSRQMAKDCVGEGQWKSCLLTGLVEPMQELWPEILKMSASEKPWISELRPIPPSFDDILGSVPPLPISSEYHTPTAEPQTPLPLSRDFIDGQTPVLSPPSDVPSDFTTDEFNRVSIPKPDITLGLSHASFSQLQGKILWDLQDSKRVLSEPHQSAIGLHFPFLVVEAKGLATGSNMVAAQNQAAVDGACALNILHELKLAVETDRRPASTDQPVSQQILFSIVTEGPIHELWVHYRLDDAYHMTALRVWRTTTAKDAREFVQALSKILEWGVSKFRSAILIELAAIEAVLRQRRIE